jgi:PIN domain
METTIGNIVNQLNSLQTEMSDLLLKHSVIYQISYDDDFITHLGPKYGYRPLQPEFVSVQDRLYKRFSLQMEINTNLLADSNERHKQDSKKLIGNIKEILNHESTYSRTVEDENKKLVQYFTDLKTMIENLYPFISIEPILIPDTNALYANPDIESWTFEEFDSFTLAITPSVLADLDRHKMEHRVEEIKKKALKLINKVKEYRRRGNLAEGVMVIKDKIQLFTIATEPDFSKTFSWLDKGNSDDRLIAETLEIIRMHAGRPVALVTADINLQNKCEHAQIIFYEPPARSITNNPVK